MGYVFDYNAARQYDDWYQNPKNRFVAELEDELVLRLLEPVRGERVLDIGCGTGRHLLMFSELGLDITGLDASPHMLGIAQRKLGHRVELHEGLAEDLPFEDNSFDIATLITTLEFVDDAQKALQEACRVAENRILLGVLNRYAIKGIERRLRGIFSKSISHLVQRLPFGCFIGMVVTLVPRFRTQNVPIGYAEQHTPAAPGLMKTPIQYGRGARR
jgi:ubiquinone/menaquinone biosynthesis C-methylase UbiE